MPLTNQIKFVIAPLLTIIFFQNGISQKLNEIYLLENKLIQSDLLTNSTPDASNVVLHIITFTDNNNNITSQRIEKN